MSDDAPKGHVKISRKTFESDKFWLERRALSKWEAWVDMTQLAQWAPRTMLTTKFGTVHLERGEFVLSMRQMAKRWGWSFQSVRSFLASSEITTRLATQRETPAGTVYLIVNYDDEQSTPEPANTATNTASHTGPTQDQHRTNTRTSSKALKAVKTSPPASPTWVTKFAEIWTAEVGEIKPARLGAALKPAVERHSAERVERAMRVYIATQSAAGKPRRVEWFVADVQMWLDRVGSIGVVDGEMTPELERLTRP